MQTIQNKMTETLKKSAKIIGINYLDITVFQNEIMIQCKNKKTCKKWKEVISRFSKNIDIFSDEPTKSWVICSEIKTS